MIRWPYWVYSAFECICILKGIFICIASAVRCSDPPEVANGKITIRPSNEFVEYGDVIEYSCDKNFNLIGKPQIICNDHGQYDESPPQCKGMTF